MKQLQLTLLALALGGTTLQVDAAPRKVILENFTATWCGYCPDVANGIILLMDEFPCKSMDKIAIRHHGEMLEMCSTVSLATLPFG